MAEILKLRLGQPQIENIALSLAQVCSDFDQKSFIQKATEGLENLELKERAKHIALQMNFYLKGSVAEKLQIITQSLGAPLQSSQSFGYEPFMYFPHSYFIEMWGHLTLDQNLEPAFKACEELTQRFTAEFCIRPLLQSFPHLVYPQILKWAQSPNEHLRRLASEGTRPRLPWGIGLKNLQHNPEPNLSILEILKNDPSLYVRRSVANHLNDIGKDHPELQLDICEKWAQNSTAHTQWMIGHSLRVLVKKSHPRALKLMGFGAKAEFQISDIIFSHTQITQSELLWVDFTLTNTASHTHPEPWLVDYWIDFVKANQKTSRKVFKFKKVQLQNSEEISLQLSHSFQERTTRKHYAGVHRIGLMINGVEVVLGEANLIK